MTHPPPDDHVERVAKAMWSSADKCEFETFKDCKQFVVRTSDEWGTEFLGMGMRWRALARAAIAAMDATHPQAAEPEPSSQALKLSTRSPDLWTPKGGE